MTHERLTLRRLAYHRREGSIGLATWTLESPVWAVVHASSNKSAAMATVVAYAQEIPWREGDPTEPEVEHALALVAST